jgi:radical SAM superfamily enzyme YgiQ (UPF0313 family)
MNLLLTAINAKYIHSNPAIYSLRAYAGFEEVTLAEYTINHSMDAILEDLYRKNPDVLCFSCYIWNIDMVRKIAAEYHKLRPHIPIWVGGPEVSYDASGFLRANPAIYGVMCGEGEETFAALCRVYLRGEQDKKEREAQLSQIDGLCLRAEDGMPYGTNPRTPLSMDDLPFYYEEIDSKMENTFANRLIYYESSRGCPFRCSYCLSSIDKKLRLRSAEKVEQELAFFLARNVPQVKFIDRTFNADKQHSRRIWRYIAEHDNGTTNFHFEIAADLLEEEDFEIMSRMRQGLIQLEIGVQTTNEQTLAAIRRKTDLKKLAQNVAAIHEKRNIHMHLDLIAGLPYEDYASFGRSFDEVYAMQPDQLQLGFLKVLTGSYMKECVPEYEILYHDLPPYEVLSTKWLSYDDILCLKQVEEMVEVYYNSGQFEQTLPRAIGQWERPFLFFEELGTFYAQNGYFHIAHSRIRRSEILLEFFAQKGMDTKRYKELLVVDLYLRENLKSRPPFAKDLTEEKQEIYAFYQEEQKNPHYLKAYEGKTAREMMRMTHFERFDCFDGQYVLFDYNERNPLTHQARMERINWEGNKG